MIRVNKNPGSRGKYGNAKSGIFIPKHPEKICCPGPLEYKSNLEYLFCRYADDNPAIVSWGYENAVVKYLDQSTNPAKVRRYYIDFVCKVRVGSGFKTVWVEIKNSCETRKPGKNASPKTILTWIKNTCKWQCAKQLAKSKGYEFHVLTEKELS